MKPLPHSRIVAFFPVAVLTAAVLTATLHAQQIESTASGNEADFSFRKPDFGAWSTPPAPGQATVPPQPGVVPPGVPPAPGVAPGTAPAAAAAPVTRVAGLPRLYFSDEDGIRMTAYGAPVDVQLLYNRTVNPAAAAAASGGSGGGGGGADSDEETGTATDIPTPGDAATDAPADSATDSAPPAPADPPGTDAAPAPAPAPGSADPSAAPAGTDIPATTAAPDAPTAGAPPTADPLTPQAALEHLWTKMQGDGFTVSPLRIDELAKGEAKILQVTVDPNLQYSFVLGAAPGWNQLTLLIADGATGTVLGMGEAGPGHALSFGMKVVGANQLTFAVINGDSGPDSIKLDAYLGHHGLGQGTAPAAGAPAVGAPPAPATTTIPLPGLSN